MLTEICATKILQVNKNKITFGWQALTHRPNVIRLTGLTRYYDSSPTSQINTFVVENFNNQNSEQNFIVLNLEF